MNTVKPTLLVTTSTFPRWSGDSEPRFVYDLSKQLVSDFNVIVLAPHAKNTPLYETWDGMTIYRYRYAPEKLETLAYNGGITANLKKNPWKLLLLPLFFLGQWWKLHTLLKKNIINTIHAHWLIPQGLIASLALLNNKKKIRLVCTSHGGDLFGLQDNVSKFLKSWVIRRSDSITVVSQAMVSKIQELSSNQSLPISVIPMGTDLTHTFVLNPTISRQTNRLLFVGRLVEKKGLIYLLQAIPQLIHSHPDLELVIAGSGPLQAQLVEQTKQLGISAHVQFVGRLTHLELVQLYQTATLAVFPFIQAKNGDMEGLGLVMVEAMGCGCPVIASELPAVRDVIQHEVTGYLVAPESSHELFEKIQSMLTNTALREKFSKYAKQQVNKVFRWENITEQYKNVLLNETYK